MTVRDLQVWIIIALMAVLGGAMRLVQAGPTGAQAQIHADAPAPLRNPDLWGLPQGRWVKIHQQQPGDAVTFSRQRHGGSAFDSRRGQLVLFGSDTHDLPPEDWLNAPLIFDLDRLAWEQPYPADPVSNYRVSSGGLPVAGRSGDHPWAMHSFGAVTYDPLRDAIVVASWPAHLEPGRFTSVLAPLWNQVTRHPTWLWSPARGEWQPLAGEAVHFFPYATAYDSRQQAVLGYRSDGIFALSQDVEEWRQLVKGGLLGWGNNLTFDESHGVLIVYGSHRRENDVVVYDPASGLHRKMLTPGPRPPGSSYVPMTFHSGVGATVVLIGRPASPEAPHGTTETWVYDYGRDAWSLRAEAGLPFGIGMNYNLEYDPLHELVLLVATPPEEDLPAVWALKLGKAS